MKVIRLLAIVGGVAVLLVGAVVVIAAYVINDQRKTINRQKVAPAMRNRWKPKDTTVGEEVPFEDIPQSENHKDEPQTESNSSGAGNSDAAGPAA